MTNTQDQPAHGYPNGRCTATSKQTGNRCGQRPAPGTTVCRFHGASTPNVQVKAAETLLRREATRLLGHPVKNPIEELKTNAGMLIAFRDYLQTQVNDLEKLTYWAITIQEGDDNPAPMAIEKARALVPLYTQALRDVHKALTDMAKLDIEGKWLALEEAQVEMVARVFDAVFQDLQLEGDSLRVARLSSERHLRSIKTG